jgi:hypothetical protein
VEDPGLLIGRDGQNLVSPISRDPHAFQPDESASQSAD